MNTPNKNKLHKILALSSIALCMACTEPGRTTSIGAATGGVIGAGLGAIVGNQVGSAGAGLVIGAAAGAGAGAAIGNALEAQDKKIAANEEAIGRKDETIQAQNAEINQLRGLHTDSSSAPVGDSYAWDRSEGAGVKHASPAEIAAARARLRSGRVNGTDTTSRAQLNTSYPAASAPALAPSAIQPPSSIGRSGSISEKNLVEEVPAPELSKPSTGQRPSSEIKAETSAASLAPAVDTSDCSGASSEVGKANLASDSADKLFHLRRALRMCPSNAAYHNQLGELYMTLNRNEDAKFEFNEALKIDPSLQSATANLEGVNGQKTASSKTSASARY